MPGEPAGRPVLSVIVPAMHVDRELRRCLDSVRLAVPDPAACEIVLVVPPSRLAEAAAGFPDARVVPETRRGVYGAMNDGVQASRGEYLYFLGKDDILLPSARDVLQLLASERPYALFADVYWGSEGVRRCRASRWSILVRNVCQQGIVYSRESVLAHGPYLRRLRIQADHLLNVRVLWDPTARGRVRYLPTPLAWYSSTGLSQRVRDAVFYQVHAAIIGRQLGPVAACVWRGYKRLRPEKVGPA